MEELKMCPNNNKKKFSLTNPLECALVSQQMVAKFYHPYVVVTVNLTWQIFQAYITDTHLVEKLHTLIKLCLALSTVTPWFIFEDKLLAKYILRKWEEGTCWVGLLFIIQLKTEGQPTQSNIWLQTKWSIALFSCQELVNKDVPC